MNAYKSQYDHSKLAEAIKLFTQLDEVQQQPEILAPYEWRIDRWQKGLYLMVVVGEVKKGKSSFVNALLDENGLSPVADKIASAVPVKIMYGDHLRYWVHFLPDEKGESIDPIEIQADELARYATEQGLDDNNETGNLGNHLAVDFVCVEHPHRLLREGLVVVDLPGLGGVFKHHARLVWEYLDPKRTDHISFVFDSTGNPFAAEEKETIEKLKDRHIERFMFLQTKTDCADPEKIQAWQETNLEQLSFLLEIPVSELKYFPISNKLKQQWLVNGREKDLTRSGFIQVENYLIHELLPAKKDWLAEPVMQGLSDELGPISQQLEVQFKIFQETSAIDLQKISNAYQEKKAIFEQWQRKTYMEIKTEMNKALKNARIEAFEKIQSELYSSKISVPVYTEIEREARSEKEVIESQELTKQLCIDLSLKEYTKIEKDYRKKTEAAFSQAMTKLQQTMPSPYIDQHEPNSQNITTTSLKHKNKIMEYVQRGWSSIAMGGAVGSMIGGPIGAIAGVFGGAWKSISETKERNKDAALSKLKGILDDAARQAQTQVNQSLRKTCEKTESKYLEGLEDAAKINHARLKENCDIAARSHNNTKAEHEIQEDRLKKRQSNIKRIDNLLKTCADLD